MGIDEMLFYGGGAVAGAAVVVGIICFLVSRLRKAKLNARLDKEYGEM